MNRLRLVSLLILVALMCLVGGLMWLSMQIDQSQPGQDAEAREVGASSRSDPNQIEGGSVTVGPHDNTPLIQTAASTRYLSISREADWPSLHKMISQANGALDQQFRALGLTPVEPKTLVYVFEKDPHTPAGKVTQITVSAQWAFEGDLPEAADLGDAEVVSHAGKRYVATTHRGSLAKGLGWDKARDAAEAAGLKRTLLEREVYHTWGGPGSEDNVIELQCFGE